MEQNRKKRTRRTIRHIVIVMILMLFFAGIGSAVYWGIRTITREEAGTGSLPQYVTSQEQEVYRPDSNGEIIVSLPEGFPETGSSSEEESSTSETESSVPESSAPVSSTTESSSPESSAVESSNPESSVLPIDPNGPAYQALYPELYAPKDETLTESAADKTVYLTFDDGPSYQTLKILDILDTYRVKATFFVIGRSDEESKRIMKEIVDRGHAIGVHTTSHDYKKIYASVETFLNDFATTHQIIQEATGVDTAIYRYPGGSVNDFNRKMIRETVEEMNRRGYVYFDWNVSSGDAERGATAESIYRDTVQGVRGRNKSIILCHDAAAKEDTVSQLPSILWQLNKEGYHFETLNAAVDPIIFPLPKQ